MNKEELEQVIKIPGSGFSSIWNYKDEMSQGGRGESKDPETTEKFVEGETNVC